MLIFGFVYFSVAVAECDAALQNVAVNKPARQISNLSASTAAAKAVDGDTSGDYYHGSCSVTSDVPNTWWTVDLMGFYTVHSVNIFRRTDCCGDRLQDFEVRVSSRNPGTFPTSQGQRCAYQPTTVTAGGQTLNCTQPITGRYVSIYKPANRYLTICELQVYGERTTSPGLYTLAFRSARASGPFSALLPASSLVDCAANCDRTRHCFAFNSMRAVRGHSLNSVTCELLGNATFVEFQDFINETIRKDTWAVYLQKYL